MLFSLVDSTTRASRSVLTKASSRSALPTVLAAEGTDVLHSVLFMQACGFLARTKYYAAWGFAECAMIVSGLGYDPETGKWNRGRNVYIRQIE